MAQQEQAPIPHLDISTISRQDLLQAPPPSEILTVDDAVTNMMRDMAGSENVLGLGFFRAEKGTSINFYLRRVIGNENEEGASVAALAFDAFEENLSKIHGEEQNIGQIFVKVGERTVEEAMASHAEYKPPKFESAVVDQILETGEYPIGATIFDLWNVGDFGQYLEPPIFIKFD
jgi:hypothetical protein